MRLPVVRLHSDTNGAHRRPDYSRGRVRLVGTALNGSSGQ